jgi:hypothetical protein
MEPRPTFRARLLRRTLKIVQLGRYPKKTSQAFLCFCGRLANGVQRVGYSLD